MKSLHQNISETQINEIQHKLSENNKTWKIKIENYKQKFSIVFNKTFPKVYICWI